MSDLRKSLRSLENRFRESKDPTERNFARDLKVVGEAVAKIERIPARQRTAGQQATLEALYQWQDDPTAFAYSSPMPAQNGLSDLPADSLKCNSFVGVMASRAGFSFETRIGWKITAKSAEDIYTHGIRNTTQVDPKNAQAGDIISFNGHCGIYLGNGLYISARAHDAKGQVSDGVQISRVPWDQNPKIYRMQGRALAKADNGYESSIDLAQGQQQGVVNNGSVNPLGTAVHLQQPVDTKKTANQAELMNSLSTELRKLVKAIDPTENMALGKVGSVLIKNGVNPKIAEMAIAYADMDRNGTSADKAASNASALIENLKTPELTV